MASSWNKGPAGLDSTIRQAIEIAVDVTGPQALLDLEAELARTRREIDLFKQALASNHIPAQQFIQDTQELLDKEQRLENQVKATRNVLAGAASGFSLSGQAALSLSYAIDDLQYGFAAIVNNIPHLVLAFGGGPGLAGALGIVTVAINQLSRYLPNAEGAIRTFGRELGLLRDPAALAATTVGQIEDAIKAINDKPFKFDSDYQALRQLGEEAKAAAAAMSHLESLRHKKDSTAAASAKEVDDALSESGATKPLQEAILAQKRDQVDPHSAYAVDYFYQKQQLELAAKVVNVAGAGSPAGIAAGAGMAIIQEKINRIREDMEKENIQKVADMFAMRAGERSRLQIQGAINQPDIRAELERRGVDLMRLDAGIANAAPDRVFEDERRKIEQKNAQKAARHQQKVDRDVYAGADADLAHEIYHENQNARDVYGDADHQLDREIRQDKAAARADEKAEREADNQRKRGIADLQKQWNQANRGPANWGAHAANFQNETGVDDLTATQAGKQIGGLIEKGTNPALAYKQVFDKIRRTFLENLATQGESLEIAQDAINQIAQMDAAAGMLRANVNAVRRNAMRNQVFRPSLLQP